MSHFEKWRNLPIWYAKIHYSWFHFRKKPTCLWTNAFAQYFSASAKWVIMMTDCLIIVRYISTGKTWNVWQADGNGRWSYDWIRWLLGHWWRWNRVVFITQRIDTSVRYTRSHHVCGEIPTNDEEMWASILVLGGLVKIRWALCLYSGDGQFNILCNLSRA